MQMGKCAISKYYTTPQNGECHHVNPRFKGGKDNFDNLRWIDKTIHKGIHAKNPEVIEKAILVMREHSKDSKDFSNMLKKLIIIEPNAIERNIKLDRIDDGKPCEGNFHARFGLGEKVEIISKPYLSVSRVIGNVYDPSREIVNGRGNLSFTTINLPRFRLKTSRRYKGLL